MEALTAFPKGRLALFALGSFIFYRVVKTRYSSSGSARTPSDAQDTASTTKPQHSGGVVNPLLECIVARRSIFPRSYTQNPPTPVSKEIVDRLLEAAMWAPFHGPLPPWRFVVLGKESMNEMQKLTLRYYDANWSSTTSGEGSAKTARWVDEDDYKQWRQMTEEEMAGRWGPASYMIGIITRRQAGSKRMPEWEEAAATACAVQNMHLQATTQPGVACYWSSWHSGARDSQEMADFLEIDSEDGDRCLGFFIVAPCDPSVTTNSSSAANTLRRSREKHLAVDWRQ